MEDRNMKILTLIRLPEKDDGTFGVLGDEKGYFCLTCEKKWKDNQHDISCIPKGEYLCKRKMSEHFGDTFEVTQVPNRSDILFHKGNVQTDSHGCILLGENFGVLNDKIAVLSSGEAYAEFTHILRNEQEFKLVIV
jgi:hypothetical protein